MFDLFKSRPCAALQARSFPEARVAFVDRNVPYVRSLTADKRAELGGHMLVVHAVGSLALLVACRSGDAPPHEAGEAPRSSRDERTRFDPARRAPARADGGAPPAPANDFEDEFAYGSADDDAAGADRSDLPPGAMRYALYGNPRFGFTLDVPAAFEAMPEPASGDGMQWRLGKVVAMTASGMNWDGGISGVCASSDQVTAHKETPSSCFATGKAKGFVHWQRCAVGNGALYCLHLQYTEALKSAMDPVVSHVNASWHFPRDVSTRKPP